MNYEPKPQMDSTNYDDNAWDGLASYLPSERAAAQEPNDESREPLRENLSETPRQLMGDLEQLAGDFPTERVRLGYDRPGATQLHQPHDSQIDSLARIAGIEIADEMHTVDLARALNLSYADYRYRAARSRLEAAKHAADEFIDKDFLHRWRERAANKAAQERLARATEDFDSTQTALESELGEAYHGNRHHYQPKTLYRYTSAQYREGRFTKQNDWHEDYGKFLTAKGNSKILSRQRELFAEVDRFAAHVEPSSTEEALRMERRLDGNDFSNESPATKIAIYYSHRQNESSAQDERPDVL